MGRANQPSPPLRFHIAGALPNAEPFSAADCFKHSIFSSLGLRLEPRKGGGHFVIDGDGFTLYTGWAKSSELYDSVQGVSLRKSTWITDKKSLFWSFCVRNTCPDMAHMRRWSQFLENASRSVIHPPIDRRKRARFSLSSPKQWLILWIALSSVTNRGLRSNIFLIMCLQ
jgi:hypothetical protein